MTTHRLARIWKQGNRWHWTLVVQLANEHAHIYQGDEPTWRMTLAMFQLADFQHGRELDIREDGVVH